MRLALTLIRTDGGTHSRTGLSEATVLEYTDAMRDGCVFPPLTVFYDGASYWLADGFHRLESARCVGFREIEVELKLGNQREAILYAVGANSTHGLRRTPADKRHAVLMLLQDAEWCSWSDRAISRLTVTSHPFVAKVRASLTGKVSSERVYTTKHGTLSKMNTSNIGRSQRIVAPRWLGLDPGLGTMRWAVLEETAEELPLLVDYGQIQTAPKRPTSERLWELEQDLLVLLQEYEISHVALEMPLLNNDLMSPKTIAGVLEAIGVIDLICYREREIVPIRLYPNQWKAHLCSSRALSEEINDTVSILFDLSVRSTERLDAIAIAYAAICGVGVD